MKLRDHIDEPRTVPLCGNSIGTDRRFLSAQLPEVEEFLHYRSIDVSTLKELARRWYPEAYESAPKKAGGHRPDSAASWGSPCESASDGPAVLAARIWPVLFADRPLRRRPVKSAG